MNTQNFQEKQSIIKVLGMIDLRLIYQAHATSSDLFTYSVQASVKGNSKNLKIPMHVAQMVMQGNLPASEIEVLKKQLYPKTINQEVEGFPLEQLEITEPIVETVPTAPVEKPKLNLLARILRWLGLRN